MEKGEGETQESEEEQRGRLGRDDIKPSAPSIFGLRRTKLPPGHTGEAIWSAKIIIYGSHIVVS